MSLREFYWNKYFNNLKSTIIDVINNNLVGEDLEKEMLDLYQILDDNSIHIEEKKKRAILAEHYLVMCKDIINNNTRKR